ncbi:hypothetical protein Goari_022310 [Gossypium aridum]|uniref:Retrovirus-related Pol polyprotein from transposon TNT 1-94 n=1 Tax=Gossypium aridum TaxID=34290 RepID=A0A7J8YMD7_GOSAI|nr:hypothetical protein [Gossypium aridum]
MMAILVQTALKKAVTEKKPENLNQIEWEKLDEKILLETLYATKSLAKCLVLKQHLYTFRINEGELLRYHISQFITLLNDLRNVEIQFSNKDQAMLLLCYLLPSYKSFREALIYGKDKLSFEDVKGQLLSRDKLDNEVGSNSKADRQASVLIASNKRDKMCRYCKKLGHVKADVINYEIKELLRVTRKI